MRTDRARARALVLIVSALAGLMTVPGGPAGAVDPAPYSTSAAVRYQVTFAARSCAGYDQVMGARVRGDGGESLGSPGRASTYRPGQPVDPDVEATAGDGCQAMPGWRFTLGSGREHGDALSVVSGTTVTTPPTVAQTPRLDAAGRPAGATTLPGAVTMVLTDDQLRLVARRQLWVQGGTPAEPLPSGYAFAVLRCGVDGHSGGNTQWLGFAAGARHAFCFAYYVAGATAGGTVAVRVRPTRQVGYPQRFGFVSPLSFGEGGRFGLASAGEQTETAFTRPASTMPYPLRAELPAGWHLAELTCAVTHPSGGSAGSTVAIDAGKALATITLGADDRVTCTFALDPPPVTSALRVYSDNGTGTFGVALDGPGGRRDLTATTAAEGVPVTATGADLAALATGEYTVTLAPQTEAWTLVAVTCNGVPARVNGATATVTWTSAMPQECVLRVARKPGSLRLRIVTAGGVAGGGFVVVPAEQSTVGWWAGGNTTGYAMSTQVAGDVPDELPFGTYEITPIPPRSTVEGSWQLTSLACSPGQTAAGVADAIVVTLTPAVADAMCTASYQLVASTRLQLAVSAAGATGGRGSSAVVEVSCVDGSAGRVVLGADDSGPQNLPEPLSFLEPTDCTISQPASGLVEGASVLASALLEPAPGNAPLSLPARVKVAREVSGYTVTVVDTFAVPATEPRPAKLLPSGRMLPATLVGVGMVLVGITMLIGLVLRRRAMR
jgi:hypothetical protein